jgi:uncharacterized protein (DUF924 family)
MRNRPGRVSLGHFGYDAFAMRPGTKIAANAAPADLIRFWQGAGPARWFGKDADFDAEFRARFLDLHYAAARRECDAWAEHAEGSLGLALLLDQFPRNAFRGTAHMYATDALALMFACLALAQGHVDALEPKELRVFLCLPFMHSEDLADQDLCVRLTRGMGADTEHHAQDHRDIIRRFGRFPHRNAALGRDSTAEEIAFLEAGGFAG